MRFVVFNTENIVSNKGQLLQDPFLNLLRKEHVPVSIYLVNGIKLQGHIESFDQYVVLLRNTVTQMVYKHAISTVVPEPRGELPRQRTWRSAALISQARQATATLSSQLLFPPLRAAKSRREPCWSASRLVAIRLSTRTLDELALAGRFCR